MLGSLLPLLKEGEKVVLIDFRSGSNAIFTYARKHGIDAKIVNDHFVVWQPQTFQETVDAFVDTSRGVNAGIVKYTAIDNITEMQRMFMSEIRGQKFTKKSGEVVILPGNKPDQDDWGVLRFRIFEIVNAFGALDCITIFTAQLDDRSGRPLLDGRTTSSDVTSLCDVVLRLAIVTDGGLDPKKIKITRFCYAEPIDGVARDRDEYLTGAFEPDYGYIFNQLNPIKQAERPKGERTWEKN